MTKEEREIRGWAEHEYSKNKPIFYRTQFPIIVKK